MEDDSSNSTLMFFADQDLCYADILPPLEVRARIELAVLNFLKSLTSASPAISDLPLISRSSSNSRRSEGLLTDVSLLFLSHAVCTRSLMRANAAKAFIRVWKVMEMCLQILAQEKRVTQRELFYKLLCDSPGYFSSQTQVNKTIQDVVALLRCSRYSLGIMASSRGAVAGRLKLQEPGKEIIDCSECGSSGFDISGDLDLVDRLIITTDARYIILIEKHAVFQRLAEDRIFNQIPSILITAKGYPDIATRNPAGLAILCTFKYGSLGMGLEAYRYACNVKWLGLRGDDLSLIPEESLMPLKPRDLLVAKSLTSSKTIQDEFKQELALMLQSGKRADIEALYIHGYDFLGKYLTKKISRRVEAISTENGAIAIQFSEGNFELKELQTLEGHTGVKTRRVNQLDSDNTLRVLLNILRSDEGEPPENWPPPPPSPGSELVVHMPPGPPFAPGVHYVRAFGLGGGGKGFCISAFLYLS
ncbi:unnamed protein product [Rhodiola kirilowii]